MAALGSARFSSSPATTSSSFTCTGQSLLDTNLSWAPAAPKKTEEPGGSTWGRSSWPDDAKLPDTSLRSLRTHVKRSLRTPGHEHSDAHFWHNTNRAHTISNTLAGSNFGPHIYHIWIYLVILPEPSNVGDLDPLSYGFWYPHFSSSSVATPMFHTGTCFFKPLTHHPFMQVSWNGGRGTMPKSSKWLVLSENSPNFDD